jgi:rhodanese-related sulfurtransferase
MKTLSIQELHTVHQQLLKTPSSEELILDVRTPGEFAGGHVPGARNIPVDSIMGEANALKDFKNVYIYCRSGGRAVLAVQILESLGLRNLACVDCGGMPDWDAEGYPSEK